MTKYWEVEFASFIKKSQYQKVVWLSSLLVFVSMFARGTYRAGTNLVDEPSKLRRYNELLHRIANFQLELARNKVVRVPDEEFFLMLADATDGLKIDIIFLLEHVNRNAQA
ncbi:hypothetical protein [Beggiatoa leptomitoformis]|uniref:Uncharacterized protein n=1 Tax=Beggiatoa leptomitoformis TaxID=288004 RepID=A0A2N9YGH5_9GAMM|nr:hypothetical protein [Beggiatoa leptomitoformis]ALG68039.1 hypothetical protein AL038_10400 [Beggiatoa leptomitoformis]AUI69671.1 hypothetical protein BLE401_13875 [Beggiatoa leptomitoformis]